LPASHNGAPQASQKREASELGVLHLSQTNILVVPQAETSGLREK
jgi:hypothetical protein